MYGYMYGWERWGPGGAAVLGQPAVMAAATECIRIDVGIVVRGLRLASM